MNREYQKGYSQELHRDMEMLIFGHAGTPLLVFPTSMGKFFEYEDRGMIEVLARRVGVRVDGDRARRLGLEGESEEETEEPDAMMLFVR